MRPCEEYEEETSTEDGQDDGEKAFQRTEDETLDCLKRNKQKTFSILFFKTDLVK